MLYLKSLFHWKYQILRIITPFSSWEKTFGKVREVYSVFIPFTYKRWIYKTDNMIELIGKMQPDDVEVSFSHL